jgi:hypothetical protein
MEKPAQHDIKEIAGGVGLMRGNIVSVKGERKMNRIHVIQKLACERQSQKYGE